MENIDVSMESNDYRQVPIECSGEHVINSFNQADKIIPQHTSERLDFICESIQ